MNRHRGMMISADITKIYSRFSVHDDQHGDLHAQNVASIEILQVCNTPFVTDQYLSSCSSISSPFFWHSLEQLLQLLHRDSKSDSYSTAFYARLQAPRLVHYNVSFSSKWMVSAVLKSRFADDLRAQIPFADIKRSVCFCNDGSQIGL